MVSNESRVRIVSAPENVNYDEIAKILLDSSRKNSSGYNSIELLSSVSLDPPLEKIDTIGVRTFDNKYYESSMTLRFSKDGKIKVPVVMSRSKAKLSDLYKVTGGDYNFGVSKQGLEFSVQSGQDHIGVHSQQNRPITTSLLDRDVTTLFGLTETVINTAYEMESKVIDLSIFAKPRIYILNPQRSFEDDTTAFIENLKRTTLMGEKPKTTFDDIGGCEAAKEELKLLAYGLIHPESYKKWRLDYPKGILLEGPSGNGETMLAQATANSVSTSFFSVGAADIGNMYYGMSEKLMSAVFDAAKEKAPSIIFIDELDSIAPHRKGSHEATQKVVSTLLTKMDGIRKLENVVTFAATNYLEGVDNAILRRFDKKIEVPMLNQAARESVFRIHCKGKLVDKIDYDKLVRQSVNLSGSDVKAIVNSCFEQKLKKDIESGGQMKVCPVTQEDLEAALGHYVKSIKKMPESLALYIC